MLVVFAARVCWFAGMVIPMWKRLKADILVEFASFDQKMSWAGFSSDVVLINRLAQCLYPVREKVAINPPTSPTLLTKLAADVEVSVRAGVAGNRSTPVKTLEELFTCRDAFIFKALAANPNTPVFILDQLASAGRDTCVALVLNPSATADILTKVVYSSRLYFSDLERLARNENISDVLQTVLIQNRSTDFLLAFNPDVNADTLTHLASSKNSIVRLNVARHQRTPSSVLYDFAAPAESSLAVSTVTFERTREQLTKLFNILDARNLVDENVLRIVLEAGVEFSQTELIEMCELYGTSIGECVKSNCVLMHPLLQRMLNPKI